MTLEARALDFAYPKAPTLLREWSARFDAGEVVAVTGPSGRGKSTLLYLLGLMLAPTGGAVLLDGVRVDALADRDRARLRAHLFGFVFQDAALDSTRTVLDNVLESALYRRADRAQETARALALLEQVSGGQAQRIALARALLGHPRFLLADEPTGNLDAASAQLVLGAMREHADGGACVIVVTHDPAVVAECDRALILEAA
jgi:ABC-type lipoprotein export system ATPase subunit